MTLSSERPERRIKLTLQYDGAGFMGWQVQPGARTVQSELEAALSRLADQPVSAIAAGRTDRGVHATGQVASALVPAQWTAAAIRRALNAILPDDIWVAEAEEVPLRFHARYDAVARSYVYRIGTAPGAWSPFHRRWCWPLRERLELEVLKAAAAIIVGRHSFKAFAKTGQPERGEYCDVQVSEWHEWEQGLEFRVRANRFLHHTVRYLVGTQVDIARGRREQSDIRAMLEGVPGIETSPPAPSEGLFLSGVIYPPELSMHEEQG